MARKRESDILDSGQFYYLTENGPWIDKRFGAGRVVTRLLTSGGRNVSLEAIERVSGWQNPRRNMQALVIMVNAWSKSYQIQSSQGRETVYYRIQRVR